MATDETDRLMKPAVAKDNRKEGVGKRKPYHPPALITYGHISKLTMANAGSGADGGTRATKMRTCL